MKIISNLKFHAKKNKDYEIIFAAIKNSLICLHNFAIPFHRGFTHNLADMVEDTKNKLVSLIDRTLGINPLEANEKEWHEFLQRSEVWKH